LALAEIQDQALIQMADEPAKSELERVTLIAAFGFVAAWAWTLLAGGGGVWLLLTKGAWPLTNGWFALFSGLALCPLLAAFVRVNFGRTLSWPVRLGTAALIFLAGHIALFVERWT
jgi:hypothetical protein